MKLHVRFRKSFESYSQGVAYFLPYDLADLYVKAGVAEVVTRPSEDSPPVAEPAPEPVKPVERKGRSKPDPKPAPEEIE